MIALVEADAVSNWISSQSMRYTEAEYCSEPDKRPLTPISKFVAVSGSKVRKSAGSQKAQVPTG